MAEIKYPIVLSVTEPNNNVGILKVRQEDTQTQIFAVEIVENGTLKDFEGLVPFFINKTKISDGKPIEEKVESYIGAQARLEYRLSNRDWQWTGENIAYFSFRKLNGDGTWSEAFSTRDFEYQVVKGVTQGTVYDSAYVWTFEDLLRLFKDKIAQGESDWKKFVDENKEIISSVDPSGELLREIIDAKGDYDTLADRLNASSTFDVDTSFEIGGDEVRPLFVGALEELKGKIDSTKFNLTFITDAHAGYGETIAYKNGGLSWSHLANAQQTGDKVDAIVYGGDNIDCGTFNKKQNLAGLRRFSLMGFKEGLPPTFALFGNHDDGSLYINTKSTPENIISKEEFKDYFYTKEKLENEVRNGNSLYFYKDFPEKKIRLIGVDTGDIDQSQLNSDGTYKYTTRDTFPFREEQLKWLATVALQNVPTDYHVMMMGHCPLYVGESKYINHAQMVQIIEAFKNGTIGKIQSSTTDYECNFDIDFSKQGPRSFIAYFAGHFHSQSLSKIESVDIVRCLQSIASDGWENTLQEDGWSVISVDTKKRKVDLFGFGRASDRSINY